MRHLVPKSRINCYLCITIWPSRVSHQRLQNIVIVTVAQIFFVSILVYIEYIAKNKKRPTGTRSFSLRLIISERVLFLKVFNAASNDAER